MEGLPYIFYLKVVHSEAKDVSDFHLPVFSLSSECLNSQASVRYDLRRHNHPQVSGVREFRAINGSRYAWISRRGESVRV